MRLARDAVQSPDRCPWIPPPPPLDLDTPLVMPDLATLERAAAALRTYQPKCSRP